MRVAGATRPFGSVTSGEMPPGYKGRKGCCVEAVGTTLIFNRDMTQTQQINLSVMETFRKRFPKVALNSPRWAKTDIKTEFLKMKVGDIVLFRLKDYNYQTLRTTPSTTLVAQSLDGMSWSTNLDRDNKSCAVVRVS